MKLEQGNIFKKWDRLNLVLTVGVDRLDGHEIVTFKNMETNEIWCVNEEYLDNYEIWGGIDEI